ncbi:MAG: FkbM family methyltransferase [Luteolibacter sp.]|uniref:FkbM family methyltransferase n=1 Tax=Luteolibacter sp. TaxID=1962973 RepID=UPI003267BAE8
MICRLLSILGRAYPIRRGRWTLSRHCRNWCRGAAVARLRCGAQMLVDRANAVDRVIYLFGEYDREEMEWLLSKVRDARQTLLYDIGANIGAYSVILPTMVPGLTAHAFEPDTRNLTFLRANIAINGLEEQVTIRDVAVGDQAGTVQFLESRGGDLLNTGKSKVVNDPDNLASLRTVTKIAVDDLDPVRGKTVLMKIDVEGYEFDVLQGMRRTLRDNACYLMIEIFPENLVKCDGLMEELGYRRTISFGSDDWAYEPTGV